MKTIFVRFFYLVYIVIWQVSLEVSGSLTDVLVETNRRRHLAYLMADHGGLVGNPDATSNLPKQHLNRYKNNKKHSSIQITNMLLIKLIFLICHRRQVKRSKSVLHTILFGNNENEDEAKYKNIRQTGRCNFVN